MVRSMSTENSCLWLAVKVLFGSKTLFGFRIGQCCAEESFGHLLSKLEGEAFAFLMESDQLRGGPLTLRSRLNTNFSSNYHFLPFPATFFETIITPFFCISLFLSVSCMYCIEEKKTTHPGHLFWSPCPSNSKIN